MSSVFIVYRGYTGWGETAIPVAAYSNIIDAVKASERLNLERAKTDIEDGMHYYSNNCSIPLNPGKEMKHEC